MIQESIWNISKFNKKDCINLDEDIRNLFTYQEAYIIKKGEIVYGAFELNKVTFGLEIRIGFNRAFRGLGLGSIILNYITQNFGLLYEEEKEFVLLIKPDNHSSIKMAEKAGFTFDFDNVEVTEQEGYLIYSKNNNYFKRRR